MNTPQLLSHSCCACRDVHHFTFVLTHSSTLIGMYKGEASSLQTLLSSCSTMKQTLQSRTSRQAHEPKCVQIGLALMLSQAALPSLMPAATADFWWKCMQLDACFCRWAVLLPIHVLFACKLQAQWYVPTSGSMHLRALPFCLSHLASYSYVCVVHSMENGNQFALLHLAMLVILI